MTKATTTKALGVMLRDKRKEKGLTQSELANLAGGVKQATVSTFENDPRQARVDTLFRLASALDLEIHLIEKSQQDAPGDESW